jgi:crotonobetaine/carnitine-CoA ligase
MREPNLLIIAHLIADRAASLPDLDVLTFEQQGQAETRTYRQLWENGQRIAAGLAGLGVGPGDRFALLLLNHPEFVETMVACAILGAVFVPIDPRTGGARLAYMLKDSECRGAICAPYSLAGLIEAAEAGASIDWALLVGEAAPLAAPFPVHPIAAALAGPVPSLDIAVSDPAQPMQIMYTSGTTGDPKGIVVPHGRFGAVSNHGEAVFGYRHGDRPYTGLSLTHGNAQFVTLAPSLKMGLRAVFSRKFTKSRLWEIVRAHHCTTFSLLGGMATALFAEPARADDIDNPVRLVISAGMPAAIWRDFETRFGVEIFEFYGAMEGGMMFKPVGQGPVGSCGRVAPGLVARIVDENGSDVPQGVPGELWFRLENGPFPPVTYLNNPKASAAKVVDGWLRSGDIVHRDEEGWIFYDHRQGGGIRRNGEFIQPAIVEKALGLHESVDDVFVYGIPSRNGAPGERDIVAAIVPAGGGFDPAAVINWARAQLPPNMVPCFLQIVSEIPKTASEKPQERFLIQLFKADPGSVHDVEGVRE